MRSIILKKPSGDYSSYLIDLTQKNQDASLETLTEFLVSQGSQHNFLEEFLNDPDEISVKTVSYVLTKYNNNITLTKKYENDKDFTLPIAHFKEIIDRWINVVKHQPSPERIMITEDQGKITITPLKNSNYY